jgi:hypothetical protein
MTTTDLQNAPKLPIELQGEIYIKSFWFHPFLTNSTNGRNWFLFKKIIDMLESDYGHKDFTAGNFYVDELEVEFESENNDWYYLVSIPNKNGGKETFRMCVYTEEEIINETMEYIEENICYFTNTYLFSNIKPEERYKEIIQSGMDEDDTDYDAEPEIKFENDNCPVCFCEYTNNEEEDLTNEKEMAHYGCCGHKLCEPCYNKVMDTSTPKCPSCRAKWEAEENDDETEFIEWELDDINELQEEEDRDTLNRIIDKVGLFEDCIRDDGYAHTLGYIDCDEYEWMDPPQKYRELGVPGEIMMVLFGDY